MWTKVVMGPRCTWLFLFYLICVIDSIKGFSRCRGYWSIVKALVRWATGKRLTNRLPKLSLITLPPALNSGILGLRMGPYVPTPKFFTISGDPGSVIYQILDMRKFTVL